MNESLLYIGILAVVVIVTSFWWWRGSAQQAARSQDQTQSDLSFDQAQQRVEAGELQRATFAGGCFWCMEPPFESQAGVAAVISGFAGGEAVEPSYEAVASGQTEHREAIQIFYDPTQVTYEQLLDIYWRQIDPTDAEGQFVDRGFQYSLAIFYHDEKQQQLATESKSTLEERDVFQEDIIVPIIPYTTFYQAEEYHQDYYEKNPLRYKYYTNASGRPQFIDENWSDVDSLIE